MTYNPANYVVVIPLGPHSGSDTALYEVHSVSAAAALDQAAELHAKLAQIPGIQTFGDLARYWGVAYRELRRRSSSMREDVHRRIVYGAGE